MVSKPEDLWGLIPAEVDPMVTVDRLGGVGGGRSSLWLVEPPVLERSMAHLDLTGSLPRRELVGLGKACWIGVSENTRPFPRQPSSPFMSGLC